jgi:1-deoxy-D-xylulose-5-phosphate synthase
MTAMEIGKAVEVRRGERVAILSFGALLHEAMAAAEELNATVVDMRWVKPLDEGMVLALANNHELLVTLEENAVAGGAGSLVTDVMVKNGLALHILNLGIPDQFIEHGSQEEQRAWVGLDSQGIVAAIQQRLGPVFNISSPAHELKIGKPIEVSG